MADTARVKPLRKIKAKHIFDEDELASMQLNPNDKFDIVHVEGRFEDYVGMGVSALNITVTLTRTIRKGTS